MKVLIIKLGALGDVILSTPIIRQIQNHHRQAELTLLTAVEYARLFENWRGLCVRATERRGLGNMVRLLRWLRGCGFDRLYDLQSNDRSGVLSALSGVPFRAGNHPRFPYTHHPNARDRGQCHASQRYNEILLVAGLSPARGPPGLPVGREEEEQARGWLARQGMGEGQFVLLHAGSGARHTQKRWPGHAHVAQALQDRYALKVVWVGGRDDQSLNRLLARQAGVDATGALSIGGLIALGKRARFALCNDSAPMHILSCCGIPVFGLFGSTDWKHSHAWGQRERVIAARHLVAGGASPTIADIRVSDVMEKLSSAGVLP